MNDMEYIFQVIRFRFKNRHTLPLDVYAREEKTALEVVEWWNKDLPKEQQWFKPRFGYKHVSYTSIPPYELEQQQIECATKQYERRKSYEEHEK